MTLALSGYAVEGGIAVGQTHFIQRNELEIGEFRIPPDQVETEIRRLEDALESARGHLQSLAARLRETSGAAAEEIIQIHIAMLSDASIGEQSAEQIREQLCNAEWALQLQLEGLVTEFRQLDDPYFRSRGEDAVQVVRLVQQFLAAEQRDEPLSGVPDRLGQTLVIAEELTPGELATLHARGVAGVITEHGSPHSHTAILARSLQIPTVMGIRRGQALLREGEQLILDGHYGVVFADPEEGVLRHYLQKQAESDRFRQSLESVRALPARSLDDHAVSLMANAELEADLSLAVQFGAEGVGLFRSEFLFLQGAAPDEDSQYASYRGALELIDGRPLVIRTLDMGADKVMAASGFGRDSGNSNPALGLRAVRRCLRDLDQFKAQLRAILRASGHGPVRCLLPMLTGASEVIAVRSLLREVQAELTAQGHAFDPEMPLGGMIEVPAAALALAELSELLDFLSVGTNDLIQYALAADRVDEEVAHLYDPQHPGVVRLLLHIFRTARELGVPVSICGELAGDRRYTRLLLALGLREFSMRPRNLLEVKQIIIDTDIARARAALDEWLDAPPGRRDHALTNVIDQSQLNR